MKKVLLLFVAFFVVMSMINPAYAVLISAGSFNVSGSDYASENYPETIYSYSAPSGNRVMRVSGNISTVNYGNDRYIGYFMVYGASGNLIGTCSARNSNRESSFNFELNEPAISIVINASRNDCAMNWNATISLGADVAENTYAIQARDAANAAKTSADTAAANTTYNGKSAAEWAAEAATEVSGGTSDIYNGQTAAYWAYQSYLHSRTASAAAQGIGYIHLVNRTSSGACGLQYSPSLAVSSGDKIKTVVRYRDFYSGTGAVYMSHWYNNSSGGYISSNDYVWSHSSTWNEQTFTETVPNNASIKSAGWSLGFYKANVGDWVDVEYIHVYKNGQLAFSTNFNNNQSGWTQWGTAPTIAFGTESTAQAIQQAVTAAQTPVLKVINGIQFNTVVYGEFGTPAGTTVNGVTAITVPGNGYTELKGTLNTAGTLGVGINGRFLLFNVVAQPTLNDTATVTFN